MHVYVYIHSDIYIYIYRERERDIYMETASADRRSIYISLYKYVQSTETYVQLYTYSTFVHMYLYRYVQSTETYVQSTETYIVI